MPPPCGVREDTMYTQSLPPLPHDRTTRFAGAANSSDERVGSRLTPAVLQVYTSADTLPGRWRTMRGAGRTTWVRLVFVCGVILITLTAVTSAAPQPKRSQ